MSIQYIIMSNILFIIFVQQFKELEAEVKWQLLLLVQQEAQLSQRGRAMLRVVENISVTQSHSNCIRIYTVQHGMCKFLLVFHVSILYRFCDIQRRIVACPWNLS